MVNNKEIDNGKPFDWGMTSLDYAKYRDIYPEEFYHRILQQGLCNKDQTILDLGTGTGVLPRNLYPYEAHFTGIDNSENQIAQAKMLAKKAGMKIQFQCISAEESTFPNQTFDVVTACQCFTYFDHTKLAPHIHKLLKENGRFAVLYMAWLPLDEPIAGKSEQLILKYNKDWTGCNEFRHPISIPEIYKEYFAVESQQIFDIPVPFTRESWHGRIKTCRGIEASLTENEIKQFDKEHRNLLNEIAPETFHILHYASITTMRKL